MGRSSTSGHGMRWFDSQHDQLLVRKKGSKVLDVNQHSPWRGEKPGHQG